jgi:hypothetical protein
MNPEIKQVYMIGFDLWGINGRYNNVYKDTQNYCSSEISCERTFGWINNLKQMVFLRFCNIQFYRVGNVHDAFPDEWRDLTNISFISFGEFENRFREANQ